MHLNDGGRGPKKKAPSRRANSDTNWKTPATIPGARDKPVIKTKTKKTAAMPQVNPLRPKKIGTFGTMYDPKKKKIVTDWTRKTFRT